MPRENIAKAAEHLANAQTALARFLSKDKPMIENGLRKSHLKIAQEEMIWAQQIVCLHPIMTSTCPCGMVNPIYEPIYFNDDCDRCSGTGIV